MEQYNTSAKKLNNKTGLNSSSTGGNKGGLVGWVKERAITLILFGVLFLGIGLMAYPTFADYWNSFHQTRAVASYAEKVADMNAEDYEKILDSAREYNQRLARRGIQWVLSDEQREEYIKQLDISGTGVMGYIKIPKIDVMLPCLSRDRRRSPADLNRTSGTVFPAGRRRDIALHDVRAQRTPVRKAIHRL